MASERRLSAIIEIGGRIAGSLGAAFRQAESSSQALNRRLRQNSEQRVELGRQIREAEDRLRRSTELTADEQERLNDLIRRARTEQERLNRSTERLRQLDQERTQRLQRHHELMGKIGKTVAMTAMAAVPLGMAFGKASEFEYQNVLIGNTADMSREDTKALGQTTLMASREGHQTAENSQKALGVFVSAGMDANKSQKALAPTLKTATANNADVEDVAKAGNTIIDTFKVDPKDLQSNYDALVYAGERGRFEFKDMAKNVSKLGASLSSLKIEGKEATATIGAFGQIAIKGASDADEAANNLQNLFQKIASPETLKKAKKEFGLDIEKIIRNAQKTGKNPVIEVLSALRKATKGGDNILLGKVWQDMQVQNAAKAIFQNWDELIDIKEKALTADGVTDKNLATILETSKQKTMDLTAELGRFGIVLGLAITPALNKIMDTITPLIGKMTDWVAKNPELTSQIVMLGGALVTTRIAILGFKLAMNGLGILRIAGSIANLAGGMGIFGSVVRGGTTVLRLLGSTLGLVTRGALMLGAALLTTPIGWIALAIAGIGAIGAAIYHWDDIKPYLTSLWGWMGRTWDSVSSGIKAGLSAAGTFLSEWGTWAGQELMTIGKRMLDAGLWFIDQYIIYWNTFWTTIWNIADEKTGGMLTGFVTWCGDVYKSAQEGFQTIKDFFVGWWNDFAGLPDKAIKTVTDKLAKIGDAWKVAKGYIGLGEETPVPDANGKEASTQDFLEKNTGNIFPIIPNAKTTLDVNSPNAPKPQMATVNNNNTSMDNRVTNNNNNNITVNQQPNQSPTALAREIASKISGNQGVSNRNSMYDGAMGY